MSFWLVREIVCIEKMVKEDHFTFGKLEMLNT